MPTPDLLSAYLTVGEAAERLGVCAGTLRNWDESGKLPALRHPFNDYRLYRASDIDALLNKLQALSDG